MAKLSKTLQTIVLGLVRCYQYAISPFLGNHCRFYPSCSHYAVESIQRFGAVKGVALSVKRVCRCHPWHEGGYDPVPETKKK